MSIVAPLFALLLAAAPAGIAEELLDGMPSDEALAKTARYDRGGLRFDYPAVLRMREHEGEVSLEYGLYELEVIPSSPTSPKEYFDTLAEAFSYGDGEVKRMQGPAFAACGGKPKPTELIDLVVDGERTTYEAVTLPPGIGGNWRYVIFQDDWIDGTGPNSAIAVATRERVLASLECDLPLVN